MIHIPEDIRFKSTIKQGSVYYYIDRSIRSPEPHYLIVVNKDPINDGVILLVCASSQVDKVKRMRKNLPLTTLVEISPEEYTSFSKPTIIDCNEIIERTIEELIDKLKTRDLKIREEMNFSIVRRLRLAVKDSPLHSEELKDLI